MLPKKRMLKVFSCFLMWRGQYKRQFAMDGKIKKVDYCAFVTRCFCGFLTFREHGHG